LGLQGVAVTEQLAKLTQLKTVLDSQDDEVAAAVLLVEDALRGLGLGVPLWTKIDDQSNLVYRKTNKSWRLSIEFEDGTKTMLCDAPRNLRVVALGLVPQLLEDAASQMMNMIELRQTVLSDTIETVEVIKANSK
jgi:hypothetical protein